jgi:hypothetical protein
VSPSEGQTRRELTPLNGCCSPTLTSGVKVQEPRRGSLPAYRRGSRLVVRGGRELEPVTSLLLKRASARSRASRRARYGAGAAVAASVALAAAWAAYSRLWAPRRRRET